MRQTAAMILLLTASACAADRHKVVVCLLDGGLPETLMDDVMNRVSHMFSSANVRPVWHREARLCAEPESRVIEIHFSNHTKSELLPGALGCVLPPEGHVVVVFYDRVSRSDQHLLAPLLAHVMAHEMTHILQGVQHHSEEGLMKPVWGTTDFEQMKRWPLTFTATDLQLIEEGLARARLIGPKVPLR